MQVEPLLVGQSAGALALNADGRLPAMGSEDSTESDCGTWPALLRRYHWSTDCRVRRFRDSVAFGPKGCLLVAASGNSIAVRELCEEHVVQRICATTWGTMTPQQRQQHRRGLSYQPPCQ